MTKRYVLELREYNANKSNDPVITFWEKEEKVELPITYLFSREGGFRVRNHFLTDAKKETEDTIYLNPIVVFEVEDFNPACWGWKKIEDVKRNE